MKYSFIVLLGIVSMLMACDKTDQQPESDTETSAPAPVVQAVPDPALAGQKTGLMKRKNLDTNITPDMVRDLRFDAEMDERADIYSDKPVNLNPAGSTRISVTPQFFLNEDEKLKENYLDYIDGASVQMEVKFD